MKCECRDCDCPRPSDHKILALGYKPGDLVSLCLFCYCGHFEGDENEPF